MRWELFWNPSLAVDRIAYRLRQRRRLRRLQATVAQGLITGHIESLELLDVAKPLGIRNIYDIGANVGTWTLLAKAIFPEAVVEAFEPLERHCAQFKRAVIGIEGVRLHPVALGSKNSSASLRVMDASDSSSFLSLAAASRAEFGVDEVEQVMVEVRRLDDYRAERSLGFADLIKLDVQGYEKEVLEGAEECLSRAKAIVIEMSFAEYYEGQCQFHELVGVLGRFGLFLSALGNHTPTGVALRQADMLFLRQR